MVKVNERSYEYEDGLSLFSLRDKFKPDADILIYNGFPLEEDRDICDGDELVFIKRGEVPGEDELEALMLSRHTPGVHSRLKSSKVGIAGLGGLGSSVAVSLARVGVGSLVIADFDVVEPSNLNRQQYFLSQIGEYKTDALANNISMINPYIELVKHRVKLSADNVAGIFAGVDVLVEAFDRADMKSMLVNSFFASNPSSYVVSVSGIAGYADSSLIKVRQFGRGLFIVGDGTSGAAPGMGLMSPRVGVAAHHQANKVLEILLS